MILQVVRNFSLNYGIYGHVQVRSELDPTVTILQKSWHALKHKKFEYKVLKSCLVALEVQTRTCLSGHINKK